MPWSWSPLRGHSGRRNANVDRRWYVHMDVRPRRGDSEDAGGITDRALRHQGIPYPVSRIPRTGSHLVPSLTVPQMAEQASIEKGSKDIQRSLDAMTQSLERLTMDVEGSLSRLGEWERATGRVREAKEVVAGCMRILEKVEVATEILGGHGPSRPSDGKTVVAGDEIDGRLYHAAKLYASCVRDVKLRQSRRLTTLRGIGDAVQSLKPRLEEQVMRFVTSFLESADAGNLTGIGRDAMSGAGIASGRYNVDPLSYAMVVKRAYDPMHATRVTEMYVEHRERQLLRLLERLSSDSLDLAPLVGFFLMELAVSEVMDTGAFLRDMWDGVGAALGAEIGAALDECDGWEAMLELKQDVVRVCRAFNEAGVPLDTTPLTSSVMKRSARYERLMADLGVVELAAAGEHVDRIDEAVRACCVRMAAYVEGLAGEGDVEGDVEGDAARAKRKVDVVLGGILDLEGLSLTEGSVDTCVSGLLSFVETVACIITSLEGFYGSRKGLDTILERLERGGRRAAELLTEKTFLDAAAIRKADGDEKGELLSTWCDALIEQFEFTCSEIDEYGFGRDAADAIVDWYAEGLRQMIDTRMHHVSAKDSSAIAATLRSRS